MMTKTHWKKLYNPNYFGAWCFEPGKDMVLTVDHVIQEVVSDEKGRKEQCMVVYFRERGAKPMICNKTNSKSLEKLAGSPYIEDWAGVKVQLYVDHNVRFGSDRVDGVRIRKQVTLKDEAPPVLCEECGKAVVDTEVNGKTYSTAQIVALSRKRYDRCLCMECAQKAAQAVQEEATTNAADT